MKFRKLLIKNAIVVSILWIGFNGLSSDKTNDFPYYTGDIYPTPQKAKYFDEFIKIYSPEEKETSCILISKDIKENDARILELKKKIKSLDGKIAIKTDDERLDNYSTIISIGDTKYRNKSKVQVPQRQEGYAISFITDNGKNVAILDSYDEQGLYWSIASLCQLFTKDKNKVVLKKAEISDYPEYKIRSGGIRIQNGLFDFYKSLSKALPQRYKYNSIMPCGGNYWKHMLTVDSKKIPDDPWRHSYTDKAFEKLNDMALYFKKRKIDMTPVISPHRSKNKFQFSNIRDLDLLQNFIRKNLDAKCSGISLWLDDVALPLSEKDSKIFKSGGSAHAFLFKNIQEMMLREFPKTELTLCSTLYMSNAKREVELYKFGVDPKEYWGILREEVSPKASFIWNGPNVCSYEATSKQADKMSGILDKKLLFLDFGWCGANKLEHYRFDPIPYANRFSPDFHKHVAGYILPVLLTPEREIFYAQVGDFLWNPKAFNAKNSQKKAIEKVMGPEFYPLAMKYREIISKFDASGFKVTPGAINELKTLKEDFRELQNVFNAICESSPDKAMKISLGTQVSAIKHYLKKLETSKDAAIEENALLKKCMQKEVECQPDDILLPSTQFFSANSGIYKYSCEPRFASWVYGSETKSVMSVRFVIDEKIIEKGKNAKLIICGQDDEAKEQCPISIKINKDTVFKGKNEFGSRGWFIKEFTFPSSFLKGGENILKIKNTAKSENLYGAPWFAVSYAVIRISNTQEKSID